MIFSSNIKVIALNPGGIIRFSPPALLKTYVAYEMSRLKKVLTPNMTLKSFMLHEIITDMALALNMEKLFKSYVKFLNSYHSDPVLKPVTSPTW